MRYLDIGVILAYLIGITWFGSRFRSSQKSLKDYFLGGRNAPWWAIGFSIVSAETSTLTVIGTPALAFNGNFGFLQVVLGYLLARIIISTLFLPHYFRGEMYTAYELMERRFGQRIRKLTAGSFLILRALAEGVRVFAISIIVSIVLGTGEVASILLIVCLTLIYTFEGGMTAVIWTDVVQMFLYIAGAILSLFVILDKIPLGWDHVVEVAGSLGKFQVFDFRFSLDARVFFPHVQFLGWTHRRRLSDHCVARDGTTHGSAPIGGEVRKGKPLGAFRQLDRDCVPIHSVSRYWSRPFRVLSGIRRRRRPSRPIGSIRNSSGTISLTASRAW